MVKDIAERLAAGLAFHKDGKTAEAESAYRLVLHGDPQHADALALLGALRLQAGDLAEAVRLLSQSLFLNPVQPSTHNNHGVALQGLTKPAEALAAFEHAIAQKKNFADAHNNRGNALRILRRHDEALDAYARAIEIKPEFARAHYNRGIAFQELHRFDEALAAFDRATALLPEFADAWWSKAYIKLLTGDFTAGWPLYEWRWKLADSVPFARDFSQSAWKGYTDLSGKTILLYAEQGLGDTIQFARYTKGVLALGAKVILEVQPALKSLMSSLDGVHQVIGKGEEIPSFDYVCPLASLPLAFKTDANSIPAEVSYVKPAPERVSHWAQLLGEKRTPRIGIVWSGNPRHRNDFNRSMMLWDLLPLASCGYELFSLQKNISTADRVVLAATPGVRDIGSALEDFSDTAAVIMHMDLVISVDTSVAHVAGALGKPVWIALSHTTCWRWLLHRSDSPWYLSARLFRQKKMGDWQSVIESMKGELSRLRNERL